MSKDYSGFNELTDSGLQLTYGLPVNEASVRAILVGGGAVTLELDSKPATIPLSTYAVASDWLRLVFKDNNDTYEYETAKQWSKESAESDTPSPLPPVEGNDGQLLMSQNGQWAPVDAESGFGYKISPVVIMSGEQPCDEDVPCPVLDELGFKDIVKYGDGIQIHLSLEGIDPIDLTITYDGAIEVIEILDEYGSPAIYHNIECEFYYDEDNHWYYNVLISDGHGEPLQFCNATWEITIVKRIQSQYVVAPDGSTEDTQLVIRRPGEMYLQSVGAVDAGIKSVHISKLPNGSYRLDNDYGIRNGCLYNYKGCVSKAIYSNTDTFERRNYVKFLYIENGLLNELTLSQNAEEMSSPILSYLVQYSLTPYVEDAGGQAPPEEASNA